MFHQMTAYLDRNCPEKRSTYITYYTRLTNRNKHFIGDTASQTIGFATPVTVCKSFSCLLIKSVSKKSFFFCFIGIRLRAWNKMSDYL